ncbi:MAG: glycosyltransferase [archaeon]
MLYLLSQFSPVQQIMLVLTTLLNVMVGIYAANWCVLAMISLLWREKSVQPAKIAEWPNVSIHLPVFNEGAVVSRLIESCVRLDYPRNKLEILVLDDSTDETTNIVASYAAKFPGLVKLIHRNNRNGFKAGALRDALAITKGEVIAMFDADFVAPPYFLTRLIPYLYTDDKIAFVQARLGHLNSHSTWVTKAVSLAIDGYFLVEQRARYAANLLPHFLGTSGIFRKEAITSVGGWSGDTLAEDLDLSIRLQLGGWKHVYVPDVVCSGEVPPTLSVFVRQQFRWAKGFSECFRKYWRAIVHYPGMSLFQKVEALFQLACYFVLVLGVVGFILAIPYYMVFPLSFLLYDYWRFSLAPISLMASVATYIAPILVYGLAIAELRKMGKGTLRRFSDLVYLMIVGYFVTWAGALAVLEGLVGKKSVFNRTPKFGLVDLLPGTAKRT